MEQRGTVLHKYFIGTITDCKSAYDHLHGVSTPDSIEDTVSSIDVVQLRDRMSRTGGKLRWAPSGLQGADGLTKNNGVAADCTRTLLRRGVVQLCDEEETLSARAKEKELRLERGKQRAEGVQQKQPDFWVTDTQHFTLPPAVAAACEGLNIKAVRVHGRQRRSRFVPAGNFHSLRDGELSHTRLTVKKGPQDAEYQLCWDNMSDRKPPNWPQNELWTGMTLFFC